ncbi:uncharacterized protein LOC144445665 isoform X2 [Glandiceps talaboti]
MSTRTQRDREKSKQEKFQGVLARLLREEDNKYCADCDAKGPRWASWNIGIFVCIRCAGIHRNLGVHISRVKSVNLDTWTEEQITSMDNMGNKKARDIYEAHLPPTFRRPQTDSPLENFIRCKYEKKQYMDKSFNPQAAKSESSSTNNSTLDNNALICVKKEIRYDETEREKKKRERRERSSSLTLSKPAEAASVPRPQATQAAQQPVQQSKAAVQASPPPQEGSITNSLISTSPVAAPQQQQQPAKQSAVSDLLSLDTPAPSSSNDLLGMTFNGTPSSMQPNLVPQTENQNPLDEPLFGTATANTAEEEASSPEKSKKSKDSIMALYGSSSNQTMYNVPGGVYMPQTQTQPQNQFNMAQPMTNGPASGMMYGQQQPPQQQQQQQQPQQQPQQAGFNLMGQPQQQPPQQQQIYNAQLQQQQYLQQYQMQQQYQQQYQMQQVQQVQQQMQALRVGTHPSTTQMGWQQASPGLQQGIPAAAGNGGWGAMSTGHTLSNQLWK